MSSNRCPKCSSDLLQHPSLISLPLSSLPKNTASDKMKKTSKTRMQNSSSDLILAKSVDIQSSI